MNSQKFKVEAYSGYRLNEKPLAVYIGSQRIDVKVVKDRWYGIGCIYFKVLLANNEQYILRYDEWNHFWEGWSVERKKDLIKKTYGGAR